MPASNGIVHVIDAVLLPPTSVEETLQLEAKVYPNPAQEQLNFKLPSYVNAAVVVVYNSMGQVVLNDQLNNGIQQLNISSLSQGTYTVEVIHQEKTFKTQFLKY